jgi:ABC-type sugar transport system ATPase subunit
MYSPGEREAPIALSIRGLYKAFGPVQAVDNVSFQVHQGEIRAICGENGAGKSTVFNVLTGELPPDAGKIELYGQAYEPSGVAEAMSSRMAIVHQEFSLIPTISVAENIFLGRLGEFQSWGRIKWARAFRAAREELEKLGLDIDPKGSAVTLSGSDKKFVELSRALAVRPKVLLLDEVTAALSRSHCEILFKIIKGLSRSGCAVVYISHRLEEIFSICDTVTVLKDGRLVTTQPIQDLNEDKLSALMIGREISFAEHRCLSNEETCEEYLRLQKVTVTDVLENIEFTLGKGQFVSIAGLSDSRADDVLDVIFGLTRIDAGTMFLEGQPYVPRKASDAMAKGLAMVPKERAVEGLIDVFDIATNIGIANLSLLSRFGLLRRRGEVVLAEKGIRKLKVKCRGPDTIVSTLSGGNKQKLMLAKWLLAEPRLLLLNNPTRGVDVGVKLEIYQLISDLRRELGLTILMVSEDMAEIVRLSDSVITMRRGAITGIFRGRDEITEENLISGML